jgi:PKD repeat protein/ribosomal protein L40E
MEYSWDFGDGSPEVYDWNATHIYIETGTYTVSVTVTDNSGATDSDTATCTIVLPPNVEPEAVITAPAEGEVDEPTSFSSAGSGDTDGEIVEYSWDFGDGSPVSHDPNPTHTYATDGTFTVMLVVTDNRGGTNEMTWTVDIAPKPGLPWAIIIGAVVVVGAAAAYYFLVMKKKEEKGPTPASLRVSTESTSMPADGRSTLQVDVTVLDETGAPIGVEKDTAVSLSTTIGSIKSPIVVPKGGTQGRSTLTAGFELGTASVVAEAEGLKAGKTSFSLVEKRRYCMHCGAQMSIHDNQCPKCGRMPPSGVDVKECKNCGEVIPIVARFCGECGASQPDVEPETS